MPVFAASLILARVTGAQTVTCWMAFNDHRPTAGVTSHNVTGYDMLDSGDMGPLRDHLTGLDLPVRLIVSSTGAQDFGTNGNPLPDSTAFFGRILVEPHHIRRLMGSARAPATTTVDIVDWGSTATMRVHWQRRGPVIELVSVDNLCVVARKRRTVDIRP